MRATVSDQGSRGVSNFRSSQILAVLLSLPMCVVAACAADTPDGADVATTTQPILSGCHILRPYSWDNGVTVCIEPQDQTIPVDLAPGEETTFYGGYYGFPLGTGYVTVQCHSNGDGSWDEVEKLCLPPF